MKTNTKSPEQKTKKENQIRFIEYEKPTQDGHFITISDSYHNVLGRIHRSYNDQTKKYEYVAFDHNGNLMGKSEKVWEVKNVYVNNREQLLEAAHQRRIESKQQPREVTSEKSQPAKSPEKSLTTDRKNEINNVRARGNKGKNISQSREDDKTKSNSREDERASTRSGTNNHADEGNSNQADDREQELEDIRDSQNDDRGDMER